MPIQNIFIDSHVQNTDLKLDNGVAEVDLSKNFILNQNSVVSFKSFELNAVINTLVLTEGKVGIGTNSPDAKLKLVNSLTISGLHIQQTGVLASGNHGLSVQSTSIQTIDGLVQIYDQNASSITGVLQVIGTGPQNTGSFHHLGTGTQPNVSMHNYGTGYNLYLEQIGSGTGLYLKKSAGSGYGFDMLCAGTYGSNINQSGVLLASRQGLSVYSNVIQNNSDTTLLRITMRRNGSTQPAILAVNYGSGADIELDGNGIGNGLYIHKDALLIAGKYALNVLGTVAQTNSSLVNFTQANNSSKSVLKLVHNGISSTDFNIFEVYNSQCSFRMAHWLISTSETIQLETIFSPGGNHGTLEIWVDTGAYGRFHIKAGSNTVTLIDDLFNDFATTDIANKYCIIADGDGTYSIKNNKANAILSIIFKGFS